MVVRDRSAHAHRNADGRHESDSQLARQVTARITARFIFGSFTLLSARAIRRTIVQIDTQEIEAHGSLPVGMRIGAKGGRVTVRAYSQATDIFSKTPRTLS